MPCGSNIAYEALYGALNLTTPVHQLEVNDLRWRQNVVCRNHKVRRSPGWTQFRYGACRYRNQDLHDQLDYLKLTATNELHESLPPDSDGFPVRESITLLHESPTPEGIKRYYAATASTIYELLDDRGNWRIVADGLGGTPSADGCGKQRFQAATLGGVTVFTNNYDEPIFLEPGSVLHEVTTAPYAGNMWMGDINADLHAAEITQARAVAEFNGFLFLANVVQGGQRLSNKVFWSDFNNPTQMQALPGTNLAGFETLGNAGDEILRMLPLGNRLAIYTTSGMWLVRYVGGDDIFEFLEYYRGERILKYPNTLVAAGDRHYWIGENGWWAIDLYTPVPTRAPWMYKLEQLFTEGFFEEIDIVERATQPIASNPCDCPVGGYDEKNRELWFSWPTAAPLAQCSTPQDLSNNISVRINLDHGAADIVDYGFDAFLTIQFAQTQSLNDWLAELGVCVDGLSEDDQAKTGCAAPYEIAEPLEITSILNSTEDPDAPSYVDYPEEYPSYPSYPPYPSYPAFPSPPGEGRSLCEVLGDTRVDDLCRACPPKFIFIASSALDRSIKEFRDNVFSRSRYAPRALSPELCDDPVYVEDGYDSILQGAVFSCPEGVALLKRLRIAITAALQSPVHKLYAEVGLGPDPSCLSWKQNPAWDLNCPVGEGGVLFPLHWRGRFFAWRIRVTGTTGDVLFGSLDLRASCTKIC